MTLLSLPLRHSLRPRGRLSVSKIGFLVVSIPCLYLYFLTLSNKPSLEHAASFRERHLLQITTTDSSLNNASDRKGIHGGGEGYEPDEEALFPEDLFTMDQLRHGAVILHIIGIIYMFYALALVCDEFFVPSLDVIAEKLGISPDVAGATFMAAGGSAPELFTSIIGVFIAKSDVGIGTIVGSAVFNILFVIAACAFAAKEALSLTAWPLVRDVFFYSISLIVLVGFFMDETITWYEALILFLWYFAYVGFMKFNESVEDNLRSCLKLPKVERDKKVRGVTLRQASNRKGLYHLMNETINPGILKKPRYSTDVADGEEMKFMDKTKGIAIGESANPGGLSQLKNHLQDNDASGLQVDNAQGQGQGQGVGLQLYPDLKAKDTEVQDISQDSFSHTVLPGSSDTPATTVAGGDVNMDQVDADEELEDPIDMSFPSGQGWKKITIYLVSFPIMFPLWLTLPDTKNPAKRKYFVITFFGSIIWIALYSYLMVWWATVAGDVIGIPPPVMGLTFLAAGTSVPDLITSVLVAKQGKGDMAVSSSVGSNIFDVTVGLPLPWLLYTLINGTNVTVSSEGVACSVTLLFIMLLAVFLCILAFKWRMTKGMGVLMLFLYFVFVFISLGFSYELYTCPI